MPIDEPARKFAPTALEKVRGVANRGLEDIQRAEDEKQQRAAEKKEVAGRRNLSPPPLVPQIKPWHCWAAASSSWAEAIAGRRISKESLIRKFANARDGGLDPLDAHQRPDGTRPFTSGFRRLASELGFSFVQMAGGALNANLVAEKIEAYGYLLLFYPIDNAGTVAHTVVVYGINYPGSDEIVLSVMDPYTPAHTPRSLAYFQGRRTVILGWSALSTK